MARKASSPVEATVTDSPSLTVTISQQAVNLVKQLVAAQGWCRKEVGFIEDVYVGGQLLTKTLPTLDSLSWIRSQEEIAKMTAEEQKAYLAQDEAWGAKPFTFTVTPLERDIVERAFNHFAKNAASAKKLGPNQFLSEIIVAFSVKEMPSEVKA